MASFNQPSLKGGQSNIAGVSSGTVLVLLAQNIPDRYEIKSWLVIAAPSITIAISFLWRFIVMDARYYHREWEIKRHSNRVLREIDHLLQDPHITACEKEKLLIQKQGIKFTRLEELTEQLAAKRKAI